MGKSLKQKRRLLVRKPLFQRETLIIKRMKTVAKLTTATIADVAQRDKKSGYNDIKGTLSSPNTSPQTS